MQQYSVFDGHVVRFSDGTRWQLIEPLSAIKLQQVNAPCEGTQVFTCICLDDPDNKKTEAVMKIKFQVRAQERTICEYNEWIASCKENVKHHPIWKQWARQQIRETRGLLKACTKPADCPNQDTYDEAAALAQFGAMECDHAPRLLNLAIRVLQSGTHEEEIRGGFVVYTLMSKLNGERITYHKFWKRSPEERDEIRAAFKEALIAVRKCGIEPHDCAMRNILWDEHARKCCIVDFENCSMEDADSEMPEWSDIEFKAWRIREECHDG